jgi:hypothetical protein
MKTNTMKKIELQNEINVVRKEMSNAILKKYSYCS